ncbi:hypothetical protein [Pseudomonas sp. MRSN 12121]|uniref:hypothetical protein n=1 Tax=Pseudomonas sp. MRSN 12121 TaxID=1611770 RepID=UPI0005BEF43D|nr:hypothetical protein [Pseudomonas sp. MRSN 12121]AJO81049.1 hypothetical protein TO66_28705 [Pseudomonas sp. MRSN 12121]
MDKAIRRGVEREFPEIAGGYHIPRFARILAISDAPASAGMCDDFRPRFAADIEVLGPDDEPDLDIPTLYSVPLPLPTGGDEMGFYAFPGEGTKVVVGFGYGLPNKPFIYAILPHGLSLPNVPKGDSIWQHSATSQQRVGVDGSWSRLTHSKITDNSMDREVSSLENSERFGSHSQTVADHSSETIGGVKTIAAVGAVRVMSGGGLNAASVGDMNVATARDMNLVVAQKLSATLGELQERVLGNRKSVAIKTWLGSETVNVLQILGDLIGLVQEMNNQLAGHTHGPTPPPGNAAAFTADATKAAGLAAKLKPITL